MCFNDDGFNNDQITSSETYILQSLQEVDDFSVCASQNEQFIYISGGFSLLTISNVYKFGLTSG